MITPEEFKTRMEELMKKHEEDEWGYYCGYDEESFHKEAEAILLETLTELGYGDGCKIFEEAPKWYC